MAITPQHPTLTIDLDTLRRNYRRLCGVSRAPVAAVVKADAYGTGIDRVCPVLAAAGAETFFVAHLSEGLAVRAACPAATIYVLNGLCADDPALFIAQNLRPVLNSREEIERFVSFCDDQGQRFPAAVHIDTGMNRLGLDMAEAALLAEPGRAGLGFDLTLIMSHLACADTSDHPLTARQIDRFAQLRGLFPGVKASLANSSGLFLSAATHHDLTRPGVALYGGSFSDRHEPLEPVVRLEAPVIALRHLRKGETVGYGAAFTAERDTRIAILAIGYADGYPRSASNRGFAVVNGTRAPIAGIVSMDLLALDVTECGPVAAGTPVSLIGTDPTLADVAGFTQTITYEILTRLGQRYHRVYQGA